MVGRDIVTIGASSGGVDALRTVVGGLPADTRASLFVVLHVGTSSPGVLSDILSRSAPVPVAYATDGAPIRHGRILIAPADFHLVIEPDVVRLTKGPRGNRVRPSVDVLFRSAASVYGPRTVGVVLTGALDDGAAGLWTIKRLGGATIVQDPAEAFSPSMPQHALAEVRPDHVARLSAIGPLIGRLAATPFPEHRVHESPAGPDRVLATDLAIAKGESPLAAGVLEVGPPSPYACPDCHGVLREIQEGPRVRYRCHTGHAHSLESLLATMLETVDGIAWSAVRGYQESVLILNDLAERMRTDVREPEAQRLEALARQYRERAESLRASLTNGGADIAPSHAAGTITRGYSQS